MSADYLFKPNGLWYAMNDEWQVWCQEHQEAEQYNWYPYKYELDVDLSNVCVLDDVESVMKFHRKYGYKHKEGNFMAIDWNMVAADHSGIELRNYDALHHACTFLAVIWLRN